MELENEDGDAFPSWSPELGKRIYALIDANGGLKVAAGVAGVSHDTLANWRDGRSEPRFLPLLALCRGARKSMDWLATGEEPSAQSGLSDVAASGPTDPAEAAAALTARLQRSRLNVDAAAIAADYVPPRLLWEELRTVASRYDMTIDELAAILTAIKAATATPK